MAINNNVQFGMVREDHEIELEVIKRYQCSSALLVASGGCTALSLATLKPDLDLCVFDPNSDQLELVRKKLNILNSNMPAEYKQNRLIELSDSGNFESLFKVFRIFLSEHVCSKEGLQKALNGNSGEARNITKNKFWKTAFEVAFSDHYLRAMFGDKALQNAPKGSYPEYFRKRIESALKDSRGSKNYFLHNILLGGYPGDKSSLPSHLLCEGIKQDIGFVNGYISDVSDIKKYDFIMLSNIFDWMSSEEIDETIEVLSNTRSGAILLFRQLNTNQDLKRKLLPYFETDETLSKELMAKDKSLFYSNIEIAVRK